MNSLYLLSFLLTADHTKAKQCFISGLEDATQGTSVFREFADSWARRTIIQNAIRLLHCGAADADIVPHHAGSVPSDDAFPLDQPQIVAILELPDFERIVFVMLVLERYSSYECSLFLGRSQRDVIHARAQAFQHVGLSMERYHAVNAYRENEQSRDKQPSL